MVTTITETEPCLHESPSTLSSAAETRPSLYDNLAIVNAWYKQPERCPSVNRARTRPGPRPRKVSFSEKPPKIHHTELGYPRFVDSGRKFVQTTTDAKQRKAKLTVVKPVKSLFKLYANKLSKRRYT